MKHWLFKSDPDTYSMDDLSRDHSTQWGGVRNFQARNYLRNAQVGDQVLVYHSGEDRDIRGLAKVVKAPYEEKDPKKPGEWVQVDIEFISMFKNPVPLQTLKQEKSLKNLLLFRQSRLSVMPLEPHEFKRILELAEVR